MNYCGYDVNDKGQYCRNAGYGRIPNVPGDLTHTLYKALVRAHHKMPLDGTGAGTGKILAEQWHKANFVLNKRKESWKNQQ